MINSIQQATSNVKSSTGHDICPTLVMGNIKMRYSKLVAYVFEKGFNENVGKPGN